MIRNSYLIILIAELEAAGTYSLRQLIEDGEAFVFIVHECLS